MNRTFAVAALLISINTASSAQVADQIGIQRGTRIRLSSTAEPLVGSFAHATQDTVHLIGSDGQMRGVPSAGIRSAEVSLGHPVERGRVMKGVLWGTAIVAGAGAIAIAAAGDQGGDEGYAWMGLALLAPIGGIVGGVWAGRTAPEVWQSVPVASLSGAPTAVATKGPTSITPARSRGKKMAIGALVGGAVGGFLASAKKSANPAGTRFLLGAVPGALIGGGLGAIF